MPLLTVGGEIDRIAGTFEGVLELLAEVRLVLDDQNAHMVPLNFRCGR